MSNHSKTLEETVPVETPRATEEIAVPGRLSSLINAVRALKKARPFYYQGEKLTFDEQRLLDSAANAIRYKQID